MVMMSTGSKNLSDKEKWPEGLSPLPEQVNELTLYSVKKGLCQNDPLKLKPPNPKL